MEKINYFYELLLTVSNKKSFFSSKRLERFFGYSSMLLTTIVWLWYHIFKCTLTATDLMMVVGIWLTYAGFNIIQTRKDIKENGNKDTTTLEKR